ncbi:MAG: MoaD/ThiS family protein [Ilumatobacter sp.]|uniref:MoaD/ThiS family protein n=1 Tax=Ilumatobacter sp. TaxID=1967498 RepID=UPI00261A23D0|nr:MoaD/ThiS family protein [Ilumatobacter sp.]MDJ0769435.1 MoaD/ThiS family protein [Ilumatobacter sp.]
MTDVMTERLLARIASHRPSHVSDEARLGHLVGTTIPFGRDDGSTLEQMAQVRLFAAARDAAGTGRDEFPGDTVDDVLRSASERYGDRFAAVLTTCKIWVNGEPADGSDAIGSADELAVLPPVSGG